MKTLRTYLAGLGSGGSLLAAAIAGFLALGALVGVSGLPSSSAQSDDDAVLLSSNAPEIAAATAAGPATAPAATPAPVPAAAGSATAGTSHGPGPGDTPGTTPGGFPVPTPPGTPEPPGPPAQPPGSAGGDLAGVVGSLSDGVEGATGIDLDLPETLEPATDILDGAIGGLAGGNAPRGGDAEPPRPPKVLGSGGQAP